MNQLQRILNTRAGGAVQRCHAIRHLGTYSNAEHQWGVAMLLWALYDGPTASRLVWYALAHDVPEGLTGDIPSTAKEHDNELDHNINSWFHLPVTDDLTPSDRQILKGCDTLDLYLWAREQLAQGNLYAQEIIDNIDEYAGDILDGRAYDFYKEVQQSSIVPARAGLLAKIKADMKESF
jgi:5'-deoxynucleotidase YfbR-like HD superfamily hydrolase